MDARSDARDAAGAYWERSAAGKEEGGGAGGEQGETDVAMPRCILVRGEGMARRGGGWLGRWVGGGCAMSRATHASSRARAPP